MKQTIKTGNSTNGMVITDMPLDALIALRDAVEDAIQKAREEDCDKYAINIMDAMFEAREAGYRIYDSNGYEIDPEGLEVVYDDDEDDEDYE